MWLLVLGALYASAGYQHENANYNNRDNNVAEYEIVTDIDLVESFLRPTSQKPGRCYQPQDRLLHHRGDHEHDAHDQSDVGFSDL